MSIFAFLYLFFHIGTQPAIPGEPALYVPKPPVTHHYAPSR